MRRCSINNQTEKFKISSDLCFCFSFVCFVIFFATSRQPHEYEYVWTVFCNSFYNFVFVLFFPLKAIVMYLFVRFGFSFQTFPNTRAQK